MTEWRICKRCGKELPSTLFRRDKDGYKLDICGPCHESIRKIEYRKHYKYLRRKTDKPKGKLWTEEDYKALADSAGLTVKEAAAKLERTPASVRRMLSRRGLHIVEGKIARKKPATERG